MDYIQLLMIGQVIWAKYVNWNAKKSERCPKSSKNKKRPLNSSKNKMFIFGLCSTSDHWPRDSSKKYWLKCNNNNNNNKNEKGPLSHQKIKCSLLDYVQLLMIGWVTWAKNVNWNAKKNHKRPTESSENKMFIFGLCSTSHDLLSNPSKKHWPKCKKIRKAP